MTSPYPVCEHFFLTEVLEMSSLKRKPDFVTLLAENTVGAPPCSGQHRAQNPKRDSSSPSACRVPARPPHPHPWLWLQRMTLTLAGPVPGTCPRGLLPSRQNRGPLFAASLAPRAVCWAHLPTSPLPCWHGTPLRMENHHSGVRALVPNQAHGRTSEATVIGM